MSTEPQIVNVLGEQVALEKTSFSPAEKFLVSFDEKYKFPEMTDSETLTAKKLFVKLFSGSSPFLPSQKEPSPPCSSQEKDLLLKVLHHRFSSLRDELIGERKTQSDSIRLRQIVDHIQRLKKYIDFAETTDSCQEVDEDILAETLSELSEDQILQLLRQFIFFILQGQHPLKEFLGRDPNPKGFVARLSRKPMTDFSQFMDEYRDKKNPIPRTIAKVLQVTQLDLDAMKDEMEDAIKKRMEGLLTIVSDVYPDDDPFWEGLDRTNLEAVLQRLLDMVQSLKQELEDCEEESNNLRGAIIDVSNEKDELIEQQTVLLNRIQLLEQEKKTLEDRPVTVANTSLSAETQRTIDTLQNTVASLNTRIHDLEDQAKILEAQKLGLQNTLQEKEALLASLQGQQEELESLRSANKSLQEELAKANQKIKDCLALERRIEVLEGQVESREEQLTQLRSHAGELTAQIDIHLQEKARLVQQIKDLQASLERSEALVESLRQFKDSLMNDKTLVIDRLSGIQRALGDTGTTENAMYQKISRLRENLSNSDQPPTSMASSVTEILKEAQEEVANLQNQIKELEAQVQAKDAEIAKAKGIMEASNEILGLVRSGRTDLDAKGFKSETDKAFLENAIRAVEAEKDLAEQKAKLDLQVQELLAKNTALQSDMDALQQRLADEIQALQGKLTASEEALAQEKTVTADLRGVLASSTAKTRSLEEQVLKQQEDIRATNEALEKEKQDSAKRIQDLELEKLRDCEEKLNALRAEEQKKRDLLASSQGQEKGSLEARINELLRQITATEGQRDGIKAELEVEKNRFAEKEAELEALKAEKATKIAELEAELKNAREKEAQAVGRATSLELSSKDQSAQSTAKIAELESQLKDARDKQTEAVDKATTLEETLNERARLIGDLKVEIINEGKNKAKLFDLIGALASWMTSKGTLPVPDIDQGLNQKYQINRIIDAFLSSLATTEVESPKAKESDSISTAMSRCYLVFFMTYVYARHFPVKRDEDSSYQSRLVEFFRGILTELYKQLDAGIPGKLEAVGSGGIPIQLKSKYVMNILLPLIKQMELAHESGKKVAEFLKFTLLDKDQLETLHKLHKIVIDKLKLAGKDIVKVMNLYVVRRTGNTDNDLENLYLRFVTESKTNKEFPVIMYIDPGTKEIPKVGFGTEEDLAQYLSSPFDKTSSLPKVGAPLDKALTASPVFSFNLLFYLFLFVVKDYLSSVEGELTKAGCPLPQILKLR